MKLVFVSIIIYILLMDDLAVGSQNIVCNYSPMNWTNAMSRCHMAGGSRVIPDLIHGPFVQKANNSIFWVGSYITRGPSANVSHADMCEYKTTNGTADWSDIKLGHCNDTRKYVCCENKTDALNMQIETCIKTGTYLQASSCLQTYEETGAVPQDQRSHPQGQEELYKCGRISGIDSIIYYDNCSNKLPSLCNMSSSYVANEISEYTECVQISTYETSSTPTRPQYTSKQSTSINDLIARFSWSTLMATSFSEHGATTSLITASIKSIPLSTTTFSNLITEAANIQSSKSNLASSTRSSGINDVHAIRTMLLSNRSDPTTFNQQITTIPSKDSSSGKTLAIGLGAGIGVLVVAVLGTIGLIMLRRKKRNIVELQQLNDAVSGMYPEHCESSDFVAGSEETASHSVRISSDAAC